MVMLPKLRRRWKGFPPQRRIARSSSVGGVQKPTDNAYIEAFNSRLRQECLNASWFLSMTDARARLEEWRIDYNQNRPHSSLGGLTPAEFADQLKPARKVA